MPADADAVLRQLDEESQQARTPAPPGSKRAAQEAITNPVTHIGGSELTPNIEKQRAVSARVYWYWVGVTPRCPTQHIDCAGINFPKINEEILDKGTQNQTRIPVIGSLVQLSETHIRNLRSRLPRTVIRFRSPSELVENGAGQSVGQPIVNPRAGFLITIPTEADLEQRRKSNLPARPYVAQPGDEPAVRYMFAQLCPNQDKPVRGTFYPETLETTGLAWPEPLE